ncbi:uncharacterized protein LOC119573520 [Penaeus monodon]|uniref:uncharacterized protein LOC119573520 n=1 Tax=Penaeus monodon TaxID=6687 RepID=UPI0018A6FD9C|nr:uncharacterized protein LOC119573520 [Penaeus monodon]
MTLSMLLDCTNAWRMALLEEKPQMFHCRILSLRAMMFLTCEHALILYQLMPLNHPGTAGKHLPQCGGAVGTQQSLFLSAARCLGNCPRPGGRGLLTVNVAKLFLHAAPMLHAFENYCVRQGSASLLLQTLEKEKELLRIFLKVSQMENTLLRRMNLHSFSW